MASISIPEVDLNDSETLNLYFQIRQFKDELSRMEMILDTSSRMNRIKVHLIANSLDLEYEYSTATGILRLSRPGSLETSSSSDAEWFMDSVEDDLIASYPPSSMAHCWTQDSSNSYGFISSPNSGEIYTNNFDFQPADPTPTGQASFMSGYISSGTLNQPSSIHDDSAHPTGFFGQSNQETDVRSHPLYHNVSVHVDGLYHCPWEGQEGCQHQGEKLKCNYDKCVDFHLKPYRCNVTDCVASNFASTACLLRHEREVHAMHGHGERPYLCDYEGCERSTPGNGFPRKWNLRDHIKRVHPDHEVDRNGSAQGSISGVSGSSSASGRRGPLSDLARAGMNAVKRVGACWRCIFLRKKCEPRSPCLICPKGGKSNWEALGCHRGDIKTRMLPLHLCPKIVPGNTLTPDELPPPPTNSNLSQYSRLRCQKRESELRGLGEDDEDPTPTEETVHRLNTYQLFDEAFESENAARNDTTHLQVDQATLRPLQDCTLDIVWELLETPSSFWIIDDKADKGTWNDLARLLPAAAVYQAGIDNNRLIAQSLICLRSCLEVSAYGLGEPNGHKFCGIFALGRCSVECVRNLHLNIELYLDELSRVLFKKDNLYDKSAWWLSAFYSFCIQAMVRKALLKINSRSGLFTLYSKGSEQYLYLPLRLFIATTSSSSSKTRHPSVEDYKQASVAVGYEDWSSSGARSSGDYLRRIFEDRGDVLGFSGGKAPADANLSDGEGNVVEEPNYKRQKRD